MPVASSNKSVWDLLGLPPGADKKLIRKKYKRFVLQNHPDITGKAHDDGFSEQFAKITEAYKTIMNADEDLFWLESFNARIAEINKNREASWRKRQKERRAKRKAKAAAMAAAAAAAGIDLEEQTQSEETLRPDQVLVMGVIGVGGFVGVGTLSIVVSIAQG